MRHTKIIATLGPASSSATVIDELIVAGVDIFRLNFSHGSPETHAGVFHRVRDAAARAGRVVAVMQDLSGPKIRTGSLSGGQSLTLEAGETLRIATGDAPGKAGRVTTQYAELAQSVRPGDRLLLDDGRILLTGAVVLAVIAPVVARVSATRGQPGAELEGPWTRHVLAMDRAVAGQDVTAAVRAWYDAHAAAARHARWEGWLTVGDASLRLGHVPRLARAFEARARQSYLAALFRARDQGSVDGVLRTAEAFAALGDGEVVDQCLRVAEGLAARGADAYAKERVRAAAALLADRMLAVDALP